MQYHMGSCWSFINSLRSIELDDILLYNGDYVFAFGNFVRVIGYILICLFALRGKMNMSGVGFIITGASFVLTLIGYLLYVNWYFFIEISFRSICGYLAEIVAYIIIGIMSLTANKSRPLCLLPAALILLSRLLFMVGYTVAFTSIINTAFEIAGFICVGILFLIESSTEANTADDRARHSNYTQYERSEMFQGKQSVASDAPLPREAYFGMFGHVLLLLLVFIVWYYIWIYRTTKYLNAYRYEEPRNPTTKLLLCMFVPFYSVYWVYKSAQRIDKLAEERGVPSDTATICLILAIFIPIVPPILMQDKINKLTVGNVRNPSYVGAQNTYERQSNSYQSSGINEQHQESQNTQKSNYATSGSASVRNHTTVNEDTVVQLRAYKELMDMGIVTKDEFEQKKREFLGL